MISRLRFALLLVLVLAAPGRARAETPVRSGPVPPEWLESRPGSLPLILAAPHGGHLRPAELPDRTEGVTVADAETADFARRLAAAVRRESGADPHLVVCRVHRIKIDCNRERAEATGGHPLTGALWETYHDAIRQARRTVEATHGHGLYVELHGHSHLLPRIELGYLLDAADLARSDEEWDGLPALAARSSVRDLARRSGEPLAALVRGPRSFGALLERHGLPAVPSPARPAPGDLPYFPGGYGVRVHGSGEGGSGTISAIQVELPRPTMRETADLREATARRMAAALREYWALHGNSR